MARVMALDYGLRRTGIAVTDPLQIIAQGLTAVDTKDLMPFLKKYFSTEAVELLLIGLPINLDGSDTHGTSLVQKFIPLLKKEFPELIIKTVDERFTSKLAKQAMLDMGMKKKDRQVKKNVDEISATIMLQDFLRTSI
ncbi:MAG: Holliday junction resolvase RuvX [Ginsengibacter sp.]